MRNSNTIQDRIFASEMRAEGFDDYINSVCGGGFPPKFTSPDKKAAFDAAIKNL